MADAGPKEAEHSHLSAERVETLRRDIVRQLERLERSMGVTVFPETATCVACSA